MRAWHICRAGLGENKCNTFSVARGWGVNYTTGVRRCCNSQCGANYKYKYGMIAQIQMQGTDYFVRMDYCDWHEAEFVVQL